MSLLLQRLLIVFTSSLLLSNFSPQLLPAWLPSPGYLKFSMGGSFSSPSGMVVGIGGYPSWLSWKHPLQFTYIIMRNNYSKNVLRRNIRDTNKWLSSQIASLYEFRQISVKLRAKMLEKMTNLIWTWRTQQLWKVQHHQYLPFWIWNLSEENCNMPREATTFLVFP